MERGQKSREEVLEEARKKLRLFQETNKTGFKEDGTYRAVVSFASYIHCFLIGCACMYAESGLIK